MCGPTPDPLARAKASVRNTLFSKDVPSEMAEGRGQVGDGFRDQVGLAAGRKASARSFLFSTVVSRASPLESLRWANDFEMDFHSIPHGAFP